MSKKLKTLWTKLHDYALGFPEAYEEFPWGHPAIKVRKKAFAFMTAEDLPEGKLSLTVKLPISAEMVLSLPYVERTGYGLGRSGWVTMTLAPKDKPDLEMYKGWIDQSYRAIAPKTLVKKLDENAA